MKRPVVIINPVEGGVTLAPAFKARGIPSIAVTIESQDWVGYGMKVQSGDFIDIIPEQPGLENILASYHPLAIIPGTEEGVPLAEYLSARLTPSVANDPAKLNNRLHKALMQEALLGAGIPALKTLHTASESEAEEWIAAQQLHQSPLIIKPPMSAGSDKVFHIPAGGDWKSAFHRVLTEPAQITGKFSETAVIQEQAFGTEFAVGTVSANGKHHLSHLIRYNKLDINGRKTVFDFVEFMPYINEEHNVLFSYVNVVLDALGVRWGAAHTEIMLTENGPRLIESGARLCGGPVVEFSRAATGSSQADKLVEVYADNDVISAFDFKKWVVPVFLKASAEGEISNLNVFSTIHELPTFLSKHIWVNDGDYVPKTLDYLTAIGIVALAGDRDQIMQDYRCLREMESTLRFN